MDEEFVDILGFEDYCVSNYGRVVNKRRDKDVKPTKHVGSHGHKSYMKVQLYKDGVAHTCYIHRLVAQAFFIEYTEEHEVVLLSEDYTDCSVKNVHLSPKKKRLREIEIA
jgi:hypothetical protein